MSSSVKKTPKEIFEEYKVGNEFKSRIGEKGIFEQSKINERFYVGDQWYGAQAGNSRPLVRRNVIKRIGEHKISSIGAAPIAVNFSAEGIPDTTEIKEKKNELTEQIINGKDPFASVTGEPDDVEISIIMTTLSEYFETSSERIDFNGLCEETLRSAYISGTAFLYTYWDNDILTGLYVDEGHTEPIKGDINCEVLDVENVNLGDPNNDDIQSQPYIIVSQRKTVAEVKREAKKNSQSLDEISADEAANYLVNGGDRGETEPENSERVTVLTKFWKEYSDDGKYEIKAIKVTEKTVVRPEWSLGITLYPIAKFCWERRKSCAYGDSEITYLIPNQIAINRALTAAVWATMNAGMPKLVVNTDAYNGPITNDPGQILRLNQIGDHSIDQVIKYLQPPTFAGAFENLVNDIAEKTLTDSGATDAAVGNIRPDNATAIIQAREASLQPLQVIQNRYYSFIEAVARIRADFWLHLYGDRFLKITDKNGTRYIPFHADKYKNLVVNAKVDVGASTLWSEAIVISTLDSLLQANLITFAQYLERLPKGLIPDVTGLIEDQKQTEQNVNDQNDMMSQFAEQYPQEYAQFMQLPPEQQQAMMQQIQQSGGKI